MPAKSLLRQVFSGSQLRQSLIVTLLVGSLLNLINQGDAVLNNGPVNWTKIALTFAVPFCVASYGAWSALRGISREKDLSS
ncbi:MAG: nitrate/nitrite transporter NrtS [Pseudomonadota bacterium]